MWNRPPGGRGIVAAPSTIQEMDGSASVLSCKDAPLVVFGRSGYNCGKGRETSVADSLTPSFVAKVGFGC